MNAINITRMILGPVIRVGLGVYVGLSILLFVRQSSMVYHPVKNIMFTPADVNLEYENVVLTTSDDVRIAAWYVPAEEARGTIIMCHGNGGNNGDRIYAIEFFHELGMNVFIFDYRGYGLSAGKPTEEGTYKDALAAWNHLVEGRKIPADSIVVHGRSLGGAVAVWLAAHTRPAGLVVESSFTSIPDLGRKLYPFLPVRLLCRYRYNSLSVIGETKCPLLIAHSRDDEMVPFEHGEKLFSASPQPKAFFELSGSHNDGESFFSEEYKMKLDEFFSSCLNP